MVVPERQMYIENSRYMAYKHFEKNQMLVCYVREKRPSQRWNVQPEQAKAIRSCLNLVGDKVSPMPALCLINDSLPAELQFSLSGGRHRHESIEAFIAVRKNWLSRRSSIIGVVIAFKITNGTMPEVKIGWSLCHKVERNKFNKYIGIRKAITIAKYVQEVEQLLAINDERTPLDDERIPQPLVKPIEEMMKRAARIYNSDSQYDGMEPW